MKCRLNRCCCFNNSQDASFASGVYTALISLIYTIYLAISLAHSLGDYYDFYMLVAILALLVQALIFLFSIILLYGVKKGNRLMLIPWMVWIIINIVMQIVMSIYISLALFSYMELLVLIILVTNLVLNGLNITCLIVVNTHYQKLTSTTNVNVELPQSYQKLLISSS